jgi:WD40 repeat protein
MILRTLCKRNNIRGKVAFLFFPLFCLLYVGCVETPSPQQPDTPPLQRQNGVYVLCEGNWRADNSTLTYINELEKKSYNDYFAAVNTGMRIGDTANDILIKGDTTYIVVSTSKTVELIRTTTGTSLGRISISGLEIRKMAFLNDSVAGLTSFDGGIRFFNVKQLREESTFIPTGPFPEGIIAYQNNMFVANSGLGDIYATAPNAGTIAHVSKSGESVQYIRNVPNVQQLVLRKKSASVIAAFPNLLSKPTELGGIVELDASSGETLHSKSIWRPASMVLSNSQDTLYYLSADTVKMIDLQQKPWQEKVLFVGNNIVQGVSSWRGMAVHPETGFLWICNAKSFTEAGEVLIYSPDGILQQQYNTGINPGKIVFF